MSEPALPQIGGYRILRVIGHGGMSTVYLGEQISLDRKVALKVMLPEALADEVSRARFENEARIIARLEHPNIVSIHEVGRTTDGLPFYSMPYLSHGHLAQRGLIGDQPRTASILRALLQALDYAHVRGVVHRDVKAENVLFDDSDRPMLSDFGIALRRGSNPRLTTSGLAVGSTAYMPPEQARGQEVDRRADVYSIGVLTWEMLLGQLPYNAGDALSMAVKHVQEPIPRLPARLKHWQGFIDKSMAKRPQDRYTSAQEMLTALETLVRRSGKLFVPVEISADDLPLASSPSAPRRLRKSWLLAAGALVLTGIGVAYTLLPATAPAPASVATAPATEVATSRPQPSPAAPLPAAAVPLPVAPQADEPATPQAPINLHRNLGLTAYLTNAEQQLRTGHLLSPPNANAWDSLYAAWRTNPTYPETLRLTALLFDELGKAAQQALAEGDLALAKLAFERAKTLDVRRGGAGTAVEQLQKRLTETLDNRIAELLKKDSPQAASKLLAQTDWLQLSTSRKNTLLAQVEAARKQSEAAQAGTPAPGIFEAITVKRSDYQRFAEATHRAAAECGRRFIFGKRSWRNTGDDDGPVTCVSAADAQAYADWLNARDGSHYRLPSSGELDALPSTSGSGWTNLCANRGCSRRIASGKTKPLPANRGYADVGIHLVQGKMNTSR